MTTAATLAVTCDRETALGPFEIEVMHAAAAYQARRIARTMRLDWQMVDDIEQDILLAILMRRRYFDASRGPWVPFVRRIAAQVAQQLADAIGAERRLSGGSLDEPLRDEDGPTRADLLVDPATVADPALGLMVARFIEELPPGLQRIAVAALDHQGDFAEACRATGLSPSSFQRGLVEVRLRLRCLGVRPRRKSSTTTETW